PRRFITALTSGADQVIIDLEDALAPGERAAARESILAFATASAAPGSTDGSTAGAVSDGSAAAAPGSRAHGAGSFLVRVNPEASADREADLALLRRLHTEAPHALAGVVVPKAESAADLDTVSLAAGGVPVLALV